ncbi:hypothetical protein [Blastococcus mobilis]|uniref:Uncharacterized protein n=1 Tax=Blastococcus mobilis TaxID=1938746 RepID=A0A238VZW7_9ACTN|nr:hypothetical protein [Blastococcus mobilis]SNR38999.1 hypothetical protein SAMN06272737_105143 [Blastococcus mobilis]
MLLTICLTVVFVSLVGLIVLLAGRSIDAATTLPDPDAVDRLMAALVEGDDCRCELPVIVGSHSPEPYCDTCGGDLDPNFGNRYLVPDAEPAGHAGTLRTSNGTTSAFCECGDEGPEGTFDDARAWLAGHHRIISSEAASSARLVPVDVQTGLTPEQVRALILDQLRTLDLRGGQR